MGRVRRVDVGGIIYHALNRANFRSRLFRRNAHFQEFLEMVEESRSSVPVRILAYCLMPNHWHLVLQPREDGDLSRFLQLLTLTHGNGVRYRFFVTLGGTAGWRRAQPHKR